MGFRREGIYLSIYRGRDCKGTPITPLRLLDRSYMGEEIIPHWGRDAIPCSLGLIKIKVELY